MKTEVKMTLYYTNPNALIEARRQRMQRMLAESFNGERVMTFPVDLTEDVDFYTLKAFLPGLKTEDVSIELDKGVLTISGEYKAEEVETHHLMSEFPTGRFARSFELADAIKADKIEASMSDGVLTLHLPKAEEAKPRTIKINTK
jgi:HSP20 family protein